MAKEHTARRGGIVASLERIAKVVTNGETASNGLCVRKQANADEEEEERVDAGEEHGCGCEASCVEAASATARGGTDVLKTGGCKARIIYTFLQTFKPTWNEKTSWVSRERINKRNSVKSWPYAQTGDFPNKLIELSYVRD